MRTEAMIRCSQLMMGSAPVGTDWTLPTAWAKRGRGWGYGGIEERGNVRQRPNDFPVQRVPPQGDHACHHRSIDVNSSPWYILDQKSGLFDDCPLMWLKPLSGLVDVKCKWIIGLSLDAR